MGDAMRTDAPLTLADVPPVGPDSKEFDMANDAMLHDLMQDFMDITALLNDDTIDLTDPMTEAELGALLIDLTNVGVTTLLAGAGASDPTFDEELPPLRLL